MYTQSVAGFIVRIPESALPKSEPLVRELWRRLSREIAEFYCVLDKYVTQDELSLPLGDEVTERLDDAGFVRIGELIGAPRQDVMRLAGLSENQGRALDELLAEAGLTFGTDTSNWRAYRTTVPETFRLRPPYGMRQPQDPGSARDI